MSNLDDQTVHPCPCCGHLTLGQPPGSYELCPVCFWEDDAVQLRWPTYPGGANRPSLMPRRVADGVADRQDDPAQSRVR
ncbi:CPCC family cysteine-rich protein [Microbacterium aurum]